MLMAMMLPCLRAVHAASLKGCTGFLNVQDAYTGSETAYIHFNGLTSFVYTRSILLPNLALTVKKRKSSGGSVFNAKMQLFPEMAVLPAAAIGITDINDSGIEKSWFVTFSKTVTALKSRIHIGMIDRGKIKDLSLAADVFDLDDLLRHTTASGSTDRKYFAGLEKKFFNLCDLLAGYSSNGEIDGGVRVSLGGLQCEYWQMDLKNREQWKGNRGLAVSIASSF